jgi:hypothetical protein
LREGGYCENLLARANERYMDRFGQRGILEA